MKITALEEYGLRCLLQLAKDEVRGLSISEISRREGLSIEYVSKITSLLKKMGLVEAIRGVHGGYKLKVPAENLKLSQISKALGNPLFGTDFCGDHSGKQMVCVHEADCSLRSVWNVVYSHISHIMDQITLKDLLNESEVKTKERLLKIVSSEEGQLSKGMMDFKKVAQAGKK